MTATAPFFSIITATCNAAETLPILLASLSEQHCRDFELVVQDARSSDGTLALLERASGIPAIELLSERDSGIYDAWNRAVARARGQWLLFLGSDDRLSDADVLGKTAEMLRQVAAGICFAAGSVRMLDASCGKADFSPHRFWMVGRKGCGILRRRLFPAFLSARSWQQPTRSTLICGSARIMIFFVAHGRMRRPLPCPIWLPSCWKGGSPPAPKTSLPPPGRMPASPRGIFPASGRRAGPGCCARPVW